MNIKYALHILEIASANNVENERGLYSDSGIEAALIFDIFCTFHIAYN